MKKIRVGTRGSKLALWQAKAIETQLERGRPDIVLERVIIKTEGDRDQNSPLAQIGGQGVFTKAIEDALLDGRIDVAVHSLKDLPSTMTDGLVLAAVAKRGPVEDVLVTRNGTSLQELPRGAVVATGSVRRRSQLLNLRPDLEIKDLRGNIETRLQKLHEENLDAIIMARAALVRLELDDVLYYTFDPDEVIPSVGQGVIGVQVRAGDGQVSEVVDGVTHVETYQAAAAERAFLSELECGCRFPVGGYAEVRGDEIEITGFVGSGDGKTVFAEKHSGDSADPLRVGIGLARKLKDAGATRVLERFRNG
jgi:hydroxymethylbilane synthase